MAEERPDRLIWIGAMTADGRPIEWYADIPVRDLSAAETAALTADQVKRALASGFYRSEPAVDPPEPPPDSTRRRTPGSKE
ncbi:MAG: hypothetical protein ACRDJ9_23205 [Dehalococcoidia bacterium]